MKKGKQKEKRPPHRSKLNAVPYGIALEALNNREYPHFSYPIQTILNKYNNTTPISFLKEKVAQLLEDYKKKHKYEGFMSAKWLAEVTNFKILGTYSEDSTHGFSDNVRGQLIYIDEKKIIKIPEGLPVKQYRATIGHEIIHDIINQYSKNRLGGVRPEKDEEFLCEFFASVVFIPDEKAEELIFSMKDKDAFAKNIVTFAGKQYLPIPLVCQRLFDPAIVDKTSFDAIIYWRPAKNDDIKIRWYFAKKDYIPFDSKAKREGSIYQLYNYVKNEKHTDFQLGHAIEKVSIGTLKGDYLISTCVYPHGSGSKKDKSFYALSFFFKN